MKAIKVVVELKEGGYLETHKEWKGENVLLVNTAFRLGRVAKFRKYKEGEKLGVRVAVVELDEVIKGAIKSGYLDLLEKLDSDGLVIEEGDYEKLYWALDYYTRSIYLYTLERVVLSDMRRSKLESVASSEEAKVVISEWLRKGV